MTLRWRGDMSCSPKPTTTSSRTFHSSSSRASAINSSSASEVVQTGGRGGHRTISYHWPKKAWAVILVPHLSGKAHGVYVAMDPDHAMDYDFVKEAILHKNKINKMYWQRFWEPDIWPGETPHELYTQLKYLFNK